MWRGVVSTRELFAMLKKNHLRKENRTLARPPCQLRADGVFFWPSRCHKPLALRALHPHLPRHWFYEHHGDAETQPALLIFTECLVHDVGIAPRAFAIVGYAFLAP